MDIKKNNSDVIRQREKDQSVKEEDKIKRILNTVNSKLPLPNPSNDSIREMVDERGKIFAVFSMS